ncbi:MAG TPA: energy transducer TonB [Vicinamibacterales bacterium]|nr:energy transducer TonB [Vicinamibacterales bacterium]
MELSDVLRERMQEPGGLTATALVSLLAHAAVGAAVIFGPLRSMTRSIEDKRPVMTITLGGAGTGPSAGGMTSIGARAVQTTEPATKPEAVRAPAAKAPEMTIPLAKTPPKPAKAPAKQPDVAPLTQEARGSTLARGDELRNGSAVGVTGARGQGFGLSTGGGPIGASLDITGDFCCPQYLGLMNDKILANWNRQTEVHGDVVVKLTIQRDGRLTDVSVERSSNYQALDLNARRAVEVTRQLTPLPPEYTNPTLIVHLTFKY